MLEKNLKNGSSLINIIITKMVQVQSSDTQLKHRLWSEWIPGSVRGAVLDAAGARVRGREAS